MIDGRQLAAQIIARAREQNGTSPHEVYDPNKNSLNAEGSTLSGVDCPICNNSGTIVYKDEKGLLHGKECSCMGVRRSLRNIKKSGLDRIMERCTLDNYQCREQWQKEAKATVEKYIAEGKDQWLIACGTPGSGKTHLCTAICGELLKNGSEIRYMLWRDDIVQLKAVVNDADEYKRIVDSLKRVPVLYIDDFLKTEKSVKPTAAEINIAFEIINSRYNNYRQTIISTELTPENILDLDEATGSRIYERSREYCLRFHGKDKNQRLK